ncbi:hypothetical protein GALMADRAFT_98482 [Galerina marginata CBS 339.88]|uniref:Threonine aspartase n=1 Tax=Galerina marginata (strain CBS 339.88) TaxID=685588 RepID=A0A067T879_GALM3|nr:hypothetical protein GALMADRAFT_98482 [Galerina marginata CBS 339.88]
MSSAAYIAVHGGAGVHGTDHEMEIKQALRRACVAGLSTIANSWPIASDVAGGLRTATSSPSLGMVEQGISILEDEERLNAGRGSNLTMDGTVECDASIMRASGTLFGSVGAVSGVKNPIQLAKAVLDYSCIPNRFGRIPPLTVVSSGAHKFATGKVETVTPDTLITASAHRLWTKWKARLESLDAASQLVEDTSLNNIQDTVGAVAFHPTDGFAAGVSSGGLLLKHPGRVGEAAVFGAGCWATQKQVSARWEGMACSISGSGEYIIRENLARKLGEAFNSGGEEIDHHEILNQTLIEFWSFCRERGEEEPAVGILLVVSDSEGSVRLWCAFTTASMAVAYASSDGKKPMAVIFRHPEHHRRKPQIYITSVGLT